MSRIIAGQRKGQRLVMPASSATRPTSDRVREAAFSLIADWAGTAGEPATDMLRGFSFCDLYAGPGAVALEAASRGAHPVLCVEKSASVAEVIRRNARSTGLDVRVQVGSVDTVVEGTPEQPFDIVWLDPPYDVANERLMSNVASLLQNNWLASDGLVVAERSSRTPGPIWPESLPQRWQRRYGETTLYFGSLGET